MQLASLSSANRPDESSRGVDAAGGTIDSPTAVLAASRRAQDASPAPRRGLSDWNPEINRQVATAQQSLTFLDELAQPLQNIKNQLSRKLTGGFVEDGALEKQQRDLARLWQNRQIQTGGGLNDQLDFSSDAQAPQHFRIRGLDQQSLQSPGKETLTFSLGSIPRRTMAAQIDPDLPLRVLAGRLNLALVSAGIRVSVNDQGKLDFVAIPSQWDRVRDELTIRGDGKRFPTGQFVRVGVSATPAAIDPAGWSLNGINGLREVVQAAQRVDAARAVVLRKLSDTERTLDGQRSAAAATEATIFAQNFGDLIQSGRYIGLAALVSSLQALPRYRIESLLTLRAQDAPDENR
jgi:hypothetical protein